MPADAAIRDRLKTVRDELASKRTERAEAKKERDAAKDAFGNANHDGKITDWPEFAKAEDAVRKVGTIDDSIADLKVTEDGILKLLGSDPGDTSGGSGTELVVGTDGAFMERFSGGAWTAEKLVGAGTPYQDAVEKGLFTSQNKFGTLYLGELADRDHVAQFLSELPNAPAGPVSTPTVSTLIQPDQRPMIATALRPLTFLDLIPTGTTNSNSIEYVQVTAIPGTSGIVAEGAVKPEVGITLSEATAPVRTLAGWIKLNKQAMDDAPMVVSMINTLLPYDVRRKVEDQVINGDGLGQNLKGITKQTGLGAPAFVTGDNTADAVLRAMTVVILSGGVPNVAALNPLDWQDLLLKREDTGAGARTGAYLLGGPASMAAATLWGLNITPVTTIAAGAPLVGDTSGCMLLVREGLNVKTSDSDQDDFIRNRVTILAETRVGFPVWQPSKFAVGDSTP
jgi:HK97 family phage major capsid protein